MLYKVSRKVCNHQYQSHVTLVKQVLELLCKHQRYENREKCEFHVPSISFFGYMIDQHVISMDAKEVQVVRNWPLLKTVKELQWFLGFASFYRRFIRNYSYIAAHLMFLLKGALLKAV